MTFSQISEAKKSRTAILILGMHRSGTSALAGMFNLLGCDLPATLIPSHASNPTGHWESSTIAHFNDRLLQSAGSAYDDWLPINPGWAASPVKAHYLEEAVELLRQEFDGSPLFTFKDPRNCRLALFWLEALDQFGASPAVVIPIRNPIEVAASLAKRDDIDPHVAQILWLRHVLDAEQMTRGLPRVISGYDELLENWHGIATRSQNIFNISWPRLSSITADAIDSFLSGDLYHNRASKQRVLNNSGMSRWIVDTFTIMLRWIEDGEDPVDYALLDSIRSAFDIAGPAFAAPIKRGREAQTALGAALDHNQIIDNPIHDDLDSANTQEAASTPPIPSEENLYHPADLKGIDQTMEDDNSISAEEKIADLEHQLSDMSADLARARLDHDKISTLYDEHEHAQHALQHADDAREALTSRVDHLENILRQRQEEIEQAWTELKQEKNAGTAAQAENRLLSTQIESLTSKVTEADRWVFRLSGDKAALESRIMQLESILKTQTQEKIATRERSEQLQRNMDVIHLRLKQANEEISTFRRNNENLNTELEITRQDRISLQARVDERFGELALLSTMLRQSQNAEERRFSQVTWISNVNRALMTGPWWWRLLPAKWRERQELRLLKRNNLFDGDAYLDRHPDVARAEMNPLRHYIFHGIAENRPVE